MLALAPPRGYHHAHLGQPISTVTTRRSRTRRMSTNPFEPPKFSFQPQQPPQYVPQYQQPQNNKAIGALVCGILGILMGLCCPLIGFPLNIAAIALGVAGMHPPSKGMAIGGVVCGSIGMVLTIINAIAGAMLHVWQMQHPGQNPFGQ